MKLLFYNDLTEQQRKNLSYLLEYANTHELDLLATKYPEIIKKKKLDLYRQNVLHYLMHNTIPIEDIYVQLCKIHFNRANNIVHFEYNTSLNTDPFFTTDTRNNLLSVQKNLLTLEPTNLREIELIYSEYSDTEINLCLVLPAKESQKGFDSSGRTIISDDPTFYFSYIWINKFNNSIVLSLPKFNGYSAINGMKNTRLLLTQIIQNIKGFLIKLFGEFDLENSNWVTEALRKITQKYYAHNNPDIDLEMDNVRKNIKLMTINDSEKVEIIKHMKYLSPHINNDFSMRRIQNAIESSIEKELIYSLGLLPAEHSFEVYLHDVNKGPTAFQSRKNIVNNECSLPQIDTRDILINMLEYSSINSIGLKYYSQGSCLAYKISAANEYFILEQTNNTNTPKELVNDVLCEFKKYKQTEPSQSKQRTNRGNKS